MFKKEKRKTTSPEKRLLNQLISKLKLQRGHMEMYLASGGIEGNPNKPRL